jgi:hypothetical protein
MLDFSKVESVLVLLEKSDDVSFCMLLDILLVVARLRIVHGLKWFQLANSVKLLYLTHHNLFSSFLILVERTEEVCLLWLMKKDRSSVKLIAEH